MGQFFSVNKWYGTYCVFLSGPFIILINGEAFKGTCDYEYTDSRLKSYTGASNASCITQFRPVVFPNARMIYKLLTLHNYHLCCFLTGRFRCLSRVNQIRSMGSPYSSP